MCIGVRVYLTAVMNEQVEEARVNAAVAPRIRVAGLGLEQREVKTLHVALAAGVAQRLEATAVVVAHGLPHRRRQLRRSVHVAVVPLLYVYTYTCYNS